MGPRKPLLCTLSWGSERRGLHGSKAVCSGGMQRGPAPGAGQGGAAVE